MFTWIVAKFKNFGVGQAIAALDNLEKPLGDKLQSSIKEFSELDGHGAAILIIDEVQTFLRAYFHIPEPTNTRNPIK